MSKTITLTITLPDGYDVNIDTVSESNAAWDILVWLANWRADVFAFALKHELPGRVEGALHRAGIIWVEYDGGVLGPPWDPPFPPFDQAIYQIANGSVPVRSLGRVGRHQLTQALQEHDHDH